MPGFNLEDAMLEFNDLKQDNTARNEEYYLLRQAVRNNFRWPRNWPVYVPKIRRNLCKPIVEQFATYMMGKGFTYNVDRPNSLEYRESAERSEKILKRLLTLSSAEVQFNEGARTGSKLGRTVFKVYKKGKPGAEHACFSNCQPDYFYGVPKGAEAPGEFSIVYYSYPIDRREAVRRYGQHAYKSEAQLAEAQRYTPMKEHRSQYSRSARERTVPVMEVWSPESYALIVGGVSIFNGDNPYKWADTGEGFIPFVVIENIRADEQGYGEADIAMARELNERINYLLSRRDHVVHRWLNPTLVWEGAPANYAEQLANTVEGGGALPVRLGGRLDFLSHSQPNPAVSEQLQELYQAILESAGINEPALKGLVSGAINTGPALQVQFAPVLATIEKKRAEWTVGLKRLLAMLLEVQEGIGDSKALGLAVVNSKVKTADAMPVTAGEDGPYGNSQEGELVSLSGLDIAGLRDVVINWPGVLPADDFAAARLEMEKAAQGLQSIYTTLEKLGTEYPDDELARVRMENDDPSLRGEKVAEQVRAQTPLIKQEQDQQFQLMQQMMMAQQGAPSPEAMPPGAGPAGPPQSPIASRMRELARSQVNDEGDFPVIESTGY